MDDQKQATKLLTKLAQVERSIGFLDNASVYASVANALHEMFDFLGSAPDARQAWRVSTALEAYKGKFVAEAKSILSGRQIFSFGRAIHLSGILYMLADYVEDDEKGMAELSRDLLSLCISGRQNSSPKKQVSQHVTRGK